jgi:hypothetical protein
MPVAEQDLWSLTAGRPEIDPDRLAAAIERQAMGEGLDFRTRLLIRDGVDALARRWGPHRLQVWLNGTPARERIARIQEEELGPAGFPSLARRLMEQTRPETVLQFLRELGAQVGRPGRIHVGGSASLMLLGKLSRHTEDIDLVDEVPAELREQHDLLDELTRRYGLRLAHFQSHFLPAGWERRVHSLGRFGNLEIHLVDPYDVSLGKLFIAREKDRDDLRVLATELNRGALEARFRRDTATLRGEPALLKGATLNWYVLYGGSLPDTPGGE